MNDFFGKTNISLIGMAGCGKSTIGVLLAKALNLSFLDTDLVIQQKYNKYLWEIIDERGTAGFVKAEGGIISAIDCVSTCIATGGSAVYSDAAMKRLKEISVIIFLSVPFDLINKRIADIKGRGVVMDSGKTLLDVYNERLPLYNKYADIIINTEDKPAEDIISDILKSIK